VEFTITGVTVAQVFAIAGDARVTFVELDDVSQLDIPYATYASNPGLLKIDSTFAFTTVVVGVSEANAQAVAEDLGVVEFTVLGNAITDELFTSEVQAKISNTTLNITEVLADSERIGLLNAEEKVTGISISDDSSSAVGHCLHMA
jgi:hypothetical protein